MEKYWQTFKRKFNRISYKIKRFIDIFKIWFSYFNICKTIYEYDYQSVLRVEQHQLKRLYKSLDKYRNHVNVDRDLYWIKVCIKLISIIFSEYGETFKVNTRNWNRFIKTPLRSEDYNNSDVMKYMNMILYEEKAWYLYHEIRKNYMQRWWD